MLRLSACALLIIQSLGSTYYASDPSNIATQWFTCIDGPDGTCHIHCDVANNPSQTSYSCGGAGECYFYCEQTKCGNDVVINAAHANNVYIIVGDNGDECMKNAVIHAPNWGNAYFDMQNSKRSFQGMQVYSGTNTDDIIINAQTTNIAGEDCKDMQIYASQARYVEISLGNAIEWENGVLECPLLYAYNGPHIAPCMLYGSEAILMNTQLIASYGIPRNIWIQSGITYLGHTTLACDGQSTLSTAPFDSSSECWYPLAYPTPNPTIPPSNSVNNPTVYPTKFPTQFPSKSPTKYPTQNPTLFPTKFPTQFPSKSPTKYPSQNPSKYPTQNPSKYPTQNPTKSNPTPLPTATSTSYLLIIESDSVDSNDNNILPSTTNTVNHSQLDSSTHRIDLVTFVLENVNLTWVIISILISCACCCGCCLIYYLHRIHKQQLLLQISEKANTANKTDSQSLSPAKVNHLRVQLPSKSSHSAVFSGADGYDPFANSPSYMSSSSLRNSNVFHGEHSHSAPVKRPVLSNRNSVGSYLSNNSEQFQPQKHHKSWQLQRAQMQQMQATNAYNHSINANGLNVGPSYINHILNDMLHHCNHSNMSQNSSFANNIPLPPVRLPPAPVVQQKDTIGVSPSVSPPNPSPYDLAVPSLDQSNSYSANTSLQSVCESENESDDIVHSLNTNTHINIGSMVTDLSLIEQKAEEPIAHKRKSHSRPVKVFKPLCNRVSVLCRNDENLDNDISIHLHDALKTIEPGSSDDLYTSVPKRESTSGHSEARTVVINNGKKTIDSEVFGGNCEKVFDSRSENDSSDTNCF